MRSIARLIVLVLVAVSLASTVPAAAADPDDAQVFSDVIGGPGTGAGTFGNPSDIAVRADGEIFVVDSQRGTIQRFGPDGTSHGFVTGAASIVTPTSVAYDSSTNEVYVLDRGRREVRSYTDTGSPFSFSLESGTGYGVAVSPVYGWVYVTENNKVRVFSSFDGHFVFQWGGAGAGNYQFNNPSGIAVDADHNVYVVDSGNDRIQKFNYAGTYITGWGTSGTGNGQFQNPIDVEVDHDGNVDVTDLEGHNVQRFTNTGTYLTEWGTMGTGPGQLNFPGGIGIDADGATYVADQDNHRVVRFRDPPPVSSFTVTKSADETDVTAGEDIHYHVTVENTGETTLTGLTVTDPNAPDCDGAIPDLAVGADHTVDCTYTTLLGDAGSYANTASVDSAQTEPVESNTVNVSVAGLSAISGTVSETGSGEAIGGAFVAVLRTSNFSLVETAIADSAGHYTALVDPGSYYLYVLDGTANHVSGFHGAPTQVVVEDGAVSDADPQLAPSRGAMSGTITDDESGDPLEGAWIIALGPYGVAGTAVTAADGSYTLEGLNAGTYRATFFQPGWNQEFWNDGSNYTEATPFRVEGGATVQIDAALTQASAAVPGRARVGAFSRRHLHR
jgi:DNA-binding beta-propeller fold protein YncE